MHQAPTSLSCSTTVAAMLLLPLLICGCGGSARVSSDFESFEVRNVMLESGGQDEEMEQLVAPYSSKLEELRIPIGECAETITKKNRRANVCDWVADVVRDRAALELGHPVDMGITNTGGVRADLYKGPVSRYDIMQVMPFDNAIVVFKLDAAQMKKLADGLASLGRKFAIGGAEIEADNEKNVTRFLVNGNEIEEGREYFVATSDFVANGGDNLAVLAEFPKPSDTDVFMRDALIDHVLALTARTQPVTIPPDSPRIRFANDEEETTE